MRPPPEEAKLARKKTITNREVQEALSSWENLNKLMSTADEEACVHVMHEEMRGKRRMMFVLRIHSRVNKLRAHREREKLRRMVNEYRQK